MSRPLISIVTPSFDQAGFIEQTLRSVHEQDYPRVEHVVVDGGSSDGSRDIIETWAPRLAWWVSEKDQGQVDAINKGLERITGDVFGFLNSDDVYLPGAFEAVAAWFDAHPERDWLCGDTILFGASHPTRLVRARVPEHLSALLAWDYEAPQPGMFWRRRLFESRRFDLRWRYCFDHALYAELLLAGHRCWHLPQTLAGYRLHAQSKTVAEADPFEAEFDAFNASIEPRLPTAVRRRSRAIRALRRSWSAPTASAAAVEIGRAVASWPPELLRRPFWGCLRRLAFGGAERP